MTTDRKGNQDIKKHRMREAKIDKEKEGKKI